MANLAGTRDVVARLVETAGQIAGSATAVCRPYGRTHSGGPAGELRGGHATDSTAYRRVLGHYPTGVCVVTARDGDGHGYGMSIGSFTR